MSQCVMISMNNIVANLLRNFNKKRKKKKEKFKVPKICVHLT